MDEIAVQFALGAAFQGLPVEDERTPVLGLKAEVKLAFLTFEAFVQGAPDIWGHVVVRGKSFHACN